VSWTRCIGVGSRHWGRYGAAGLLLVAHEDDVPRVLVDRRADWVHQGGTVGIPGGAIHEGETVLDAALREATEEAAGLDELDPQILGSHQQACDVCERWTYTTVVAGVPMVLPVKPRSYESAGYDWVDVSQVESLPLHPGLRRAWPSLRTLLSRTD
jgi:8-oxo-dGTP diphosphatase